MNHSNSTQTDWSMIAAAIAGDGDIAEAEAAMEQLARRYWPAIYAYVRSTGCNVDKAADLTQGFMCDVVIARRLFELADPKRGRFRSLLLTALQNYLRGEQRVNARGRSTRRENRTPKTAAPDGKRTRRSAAPRGGFVLNLSDLDGYEPVGVPSPESAFAAQWTALLLRSVLDDVRRRCIADGLEPHWIIFEERVVRPMLFGEAPTSYALLAERLELPDSSQGPNMMVTVKRRFARAIYLEVCTTVDNSIDAEGELFELLRDLERQ